MKHLQTFENYSVNEEQWSSIAKGASLLGQKIAYKAGRVGKALVKDLENLFSGTVYKKPEGGFTRTRNLSRELSTGLPKTFKMSQMLRDQLNQRNKEILDLLIELGPSGLEKGALQKLGKLTPSEWWTRNATRMSNSEIDDVNNIFNTNTEVKISQLKNITSNMGVDEFGPYLLITMEGSDSVGTVGLSEIKSLLRMINSGDFGLDTFKRFDKYKLFGTNSTLGDLAKSIRDVRMSGKTDVPGYKPGTGTGKYYTPGSDKYTKDAYGK